MRLRNVKTGVEVDISECLVIGRKRGDINFKDDPKISGKHAQFTYDEDENCYYVEDLNSTNGTHLNKQRIEPGLKRRINVGDRVRIGHQSFMIVSEDRDSCEKTIAIKIPGLEEKQKEQEELEEQRPRLSLSFLSKESFIQYAKAWNPKNQSELKFHITTKIMLALWGFVVFGGCFSVLDLRGYPDELSQKAFIGVSAWLFWALLTGFLFFYPFFYFNNLTEPKYEKLRLFATGIGSPLLVCFPLMIAMSIVSAIPFTPQHWQYVMERAMNHSYNKPSIALEILEEAEAKNQLLFASPDWTAEYNFRRAEILFPSERVKRMAQVYMHAKAKSFDESSVPNLIMAKDSYKETLPLGHIRRVNLERAIAEWSLENYDWILLEKSMEKFKNEYNAFLKSEKRKRIDKRILLSTLFFQSEMKLKVAKKREQMEKYFKALEENEQFLVKNYAISPSLAAIKLYELSLEWIEQKNFDKAMRVAKRSLDLMTNENIKLDWKINREKRYFREQIHRAVSSIAYSQEKYDLAEKHKLHADKFRTKVVGRKRVRKKNEMYRAPTAY